jgi:hypothetical protein
VDAVGDEASGSGIVVAEAFLELGPERRLTAFSQYAAEGQLSVAVVEKDFFSTPSARDQRPDHS